MAQSKDNVLTHGMSGKLGNLVVFRRRGSKIIVAKKPKAKTFISLAQKQVNDKFQLASIYALAAIADTAPYHALYAAKAGDGISAYNVAVADYFNAPEIHDIDIDAYTGAIGSKIQIKVTDDIMVKTVKISITNSNGTLVEDGFAVQDADGLHWTYTATQANAPLSGDKVTATATDLPANMTVLDKLLP